MRMEREGKEGKGSYRRVVASYWRTDFCAGLLVCV